MSPVQRPISGTALIFTLEDAMRIVRAQLGSASRIARTLVKNGPLRATLIGLAPGGALTPHSTEGPITAQVLEGEIEFEADGKSWSLPAGSMIALGAGVVHSARSAAGGFLLLTVATPVRGDDNSAATENPESSS
jgi:quercetin dioxygenase-like cupin family protein